MLRGAGGGEKSGAGVVFSSRAVLFPSSPAGRPSACVVIGLIYFFKSACLFRYVHFYNKFFKSFYCGKMRTYNLPFELFLSLQFSGIKYIHSVI